jgi:hypothetical protein
VSLLRSFAAGKAAPLRIGLDVRLLAPVRRPAHFLGRLRFSLHQP